MEDEELLAQIYARIDQEIEEGRPLLDAMLAESHRDVDALLAQLIADTSLANLLALLDE